MWIIPLILLGVIAVAAASKSPREVAPPSRQLPPPASGSSAVAGSSGAISALGEILQAGQSPPPPVILSAIVEAQGLGRDDLASEIVRVFVAPVVHAHQRANPPRPEYERGTCALRSPRAEADQPRGTCAAPGAPASIATPQMATRPATEEEILAMLHVDPRVFLQMVSSGRPPMIEVPIEAAAVAAPSAPAPVVAPPPVSPAVADQALAMAPGSPLGAVSDDAWRTFVTLLAREAPEFNSSRHVGQYRQRRERLAELGIDPRAIDGSAAAQRSALDADLADAHGHAAAGGLLDEHVGRSIPVPGQEGPATITLSGVLGVIQCAGLEGAVGWLENPSDRKRYPHTTQAFLRSNGIF